MKIQNSQYLLQLQNQQKSSKAVDKSAAQGASFQDILKTKTGQINSAAAQGSASASGTDVNPVSALKFSKHAVNRLSDRNIDLNQELMERLNAGVQSAGEKGIKESLVMVDRLAFIVNIPNNTVVTAMDSTNTNENIYTNIDGAVIA